MIWSALFIISIAQGLFLISLLVYRKSENITATRLIIAILGLMIFTNFGYIVVRSHLKYYIPQFFGIPFGMMFLFGPLFYFYAKAVMDNSFQWKKKYWLHFIPYFFQLLLNMPFLLMDRGIWINYIDLFLSGNLSIRFFEKITFALQDFHLFVYLLATLRWIESAKKNYRDVRYIVPVSSRIQWLVAFFYCFFIFLITVFVLYIFILVNGKYNPVTNYIYTLVTSGIIYFIAYKLVLNPGLVNPGFAQKYRTYMQFENKDADKYLNRLKVLMDETKVYLNPDFKLSSLAEELKLPSHQVSKLINEKLNKSFNDLVNEYRVNEFIRRITKVENQSYTIYGIALDVGFSSKSSFNSAFKKITGKTPSEYKPAS